MKFPIILKSRISAELQSYFKQGYAKAIKEKNEEIEHILKDHSNELFLMAQEHTADKEILIDEIKMLKAEISAFKNSKRQLEKDKKIIHTVSNKLCFNFDKARDIIANISGTFNGYHDELQKLKKVK